MPLNPGLVGRTYHSERAFEVSREHIRRFADAIGDTNPVYRDPSAAAALGYPDVIAPPTFVTTVGISLRGTGPLDEPDLGLDRRRIVHGEQRFVHHRPVRPGDVLRTVATVVDVHASGANEFLSIRTDIVANHEEMVCSAYSVLAYRG
jgi:acyl dehydratase